MNNLIIDSCILMQHRFLLNYFLHKLTFSEMQSINKGSGYFAINDILLLKAILPRVICDWSVLMMY